MKRAILGLAVLALLFGGVRQAKAGLIGTTVDTKFYYPDLSTLQQDYGSQLVESHGFFLVTSPVRPRPSPTLRSFIQVRPFRDLRHCQLQRFRFRLPRFGEPHY